MKSHLADGFDEKIRCFENILAIDPENVAARAGRDSLLSIFGTMEAAEAEAGSRAETTSQSNFVASHEVTIDKSPTQDLELPEALADSSFQTEAVTEFSNYPNSEEQNVNYTAQNVAEPFASYAEEIQEPSHVDFASISSTEVVPEIEVENEPQSAFADPQAETVAFSYDAALEYSAPVEDEVPSPSGEFEIPMPSSDLPSVQASGFETVLEARTPVPEHVVSEPDDFVSEPSIEVSEVVNVRPESIECMFCHQANEPQSISCRSCMAVLTLSDLELLLANQNADKLILRQAVEDMERRRSGRDASIGELVALGIGHLNLRNLKLGYTCLAEASKLDPNNVVLSGQVNSLLIRLDEIKQQEEAHLKMPKGKTILVVDDSPTVRKLIAGKLEKSGHEVICANDGVEAMESLESMVPDLILLDITMPRMDGYQACKNIRSKSSTKDVPIVMISGKDGFFDKVRGRMAGTTGYITKPFGPETLMKAVEMYLAGEVPDLDDEV